MADTVLFIHGAGGGAFEADAKLADSLRRELGPAFEIRYPRIPEDDDIPYRGWKEFIVAGLAGTDRSFLVGHSVGASVIARYLADGDPAPGLAGACLVAAPFWHDHEFWHWPEARLPNDAAARLPAGLPFYLYHGRDDASVPFEHLEMYAALLPQAVVRRLDGRDHQLGGDLAVVARDIEAVARAGAP
jgi:predicted alpha/beta hydrolase family esterase